jgi:hypothetical protein
VEIQVCEDLDLRAHLAARRVRLWGHSPRFADYFGLDTVLDPFAQAPEERYPLLRELWALRTITSTRTAPGAWLDDVDDEIREHVLAAT